MSQSISTKNKRLQGIANAIGTFPDFPKKGIIFRDIFSALRDPSVTRDILEELKLTIKQHVLSLYPKIDAVIGLDSRGFLFGLPVSCELNCAFIPVRKAGKLPGQCYSISYALEYGEATLELQEDALRSGNKVILVDDLLATGGSLEASINLVRKSGAIPVGAVMVIELADLRGRERLEALSVPVHSLLTF